ncbi:MAG: class IIb bacteriocin, lactobin A/cerein 7B family [Tenacibaculum sp.]
MITQKQIKESQELLYNLIKKSHESELFKNELIENPKLAISKELGYNYTLPKGKNNIVVEDQTDDAVIYLNIPAEPNLDEIELTEEQLEMVAGGISPTALSSNVCIGLAVAGVCYLLGRNT